MLPVLWILEPTKLLKDDRIQKVVTYEVGRNTGKGHEKSF